MRIAWSASSSTSASLMQKRCALAAPGRNVACRRVSPPRRHRRAASACRPSDRLSTARWPWREGRLVDIELVGIDLALHDVLAEPIGTGDEHHVAKAGFGIEREDDAARRQIGADHLHHADRQSDLEMVEAVVDAVDDGAVGEDRGEAAPARLEQIVFAAHIEKALMLSGKTRGRQVFGGRRAAHRDRDIGAAFGFERSIRRSDLLAQARYFRSLGRRCGGPPQRARRGAQCRGGRTPSGGATRPRIARR